MLEEIFDAIRCQSERIQFAGKDYEVREVEAAQSLALDEELRDELGKDGSSHADMLYWSIVVRSVFTAEGAPAFTEADIQKLRKGSRRKLQPLLNAVDRVNGLAVEANEKK
jgi:hypothetical protein